MHDSLPAVILGALAADAVSMPVHWYYDTKALDSDYGKIEHYLAPRNPHPDSILWRSRYTPRNADADILGDNARYWGQRGIHYHQFLAAGENTVNFKLGIELYRTVTENRRYDPDIWLEHYIRLMRTPAWHGDTYVEEYHRAFFDRLASGKKPRDCGIDDLHIGGLTHVPFLYAALREIGATETSSLVEQVLAHLDLTHRNRHIREAADALVRMFQAVHHGSPLKTAINDHGNRWAKPEKLRFWGTLEDRTVIGRNLSPACYLPESFTASLYIAWKYADGFTPGILANACCGGDNCHRGAVVGALLGLANGVPERWITDLKISLQSLPDPFSSSPFAVNKNS